MVWTALKILVPVMLVSACETDQWRQPPAANFTPQPVYCYQSLADVDCYALPHDRDRGRFVGYYGLWPGYGPRSQDPHSWTPDTHQARLAVDSQGNRWRP